MKYVIAEVDFWEKTGFDTTFWRKSADGSQAIAHYENVLHMVPKIDEATGVKVYDSVQTTFQTLMGSASWTSTTPNTLPNSYALLANLEEFKLTYGQELTSTTAKTNKKIYFASTVASMKTISYLAGDVIHTTGYHTANDGGAAEYYVTNTVLTEEGTFSHTLYNSLYARLVIKNNTVNIKQLGAKADYGGGDTDNFDTIQKAFDSSVPIIDFVGSGYWVNDSPTRQLKLSRWIEIKGRNATLLCQSGIFVNSNVDSREITIKDLRIVSTNTYAKGEMRRGIGLDIGNRTYKDGKYDTTIWGGNFVFENLVVQGFHVGIKCNLVYQSKMNNIVSYYNDICYYFIALDNLNVSNIVNLYQISALYGTYGIVLENVYNALFTNTTIENIDYSYVIDNFSREVEFQNSWMEFIHESNVVFGTINEATLALTKSNMTNNKVKWSDSRYSVEEKFETLNGSTTFFDESTPFTARYREVNEPRMNFDSIMANGIQYKNLSPDGLSNLDYANGTTTITNGVNTPFGPRRVVKTIGADNTGPILLYCKSQPWIAGHTYLIKTRIKASRMTDTYIEINDHWNIHATMSREVNAPANSWTTISSIVKVKANLTGITLHENGRFYLNVNKGKTGLTIEAIEPMVIDLTDTFGLGNEPDSGLNADVEKYFSYIKELRTSRTGNVADYSSKERIPVSLLNGWTGNASYKYLGNGLTEVSGYALGTGTIFSYGTLLFTLPLDYAPVNTSANVALVSNIDPYNKLMTVIVNNEGQVMIYPTADTVAPNFASAAVQFNFIISSNKL